MKTPNILSLVLGSSVLFSSLSAQSLRTAYFSDSYIYRHRMNPALASEDSYFAMPLLGNTSIDFGNNAGINNFVFSNNGKLVTALHESVSANKFLGDLPDDIGMGFTGDLTLLSFGRKGIKSYTTFDITLHGEAGLSLPKDLFSFAKEMDSQKKYHFSDASMEARSWVSVAYGYSRNVNDVLRIGFKLKGLVGIGYADLEVEEGSANFGSDSWDMSLRGSLTSNFGKNGFKKDEKGHFDGIDEYEFGVKGWGLGIDLGATYDMKYVVEGLTLSAALTDLGFICWSDCASARNEGRTFQFSGFQKFTIHDEVNHTAGSRNGSLSNQWDDIHDDLESMTSFKVDEGLSNKTEALAVTFCTGAEYELPAFRQLSFGLLYTQRFAKVMGYSELRATANYAPSTIFDLALSAASTTWGFAFGASANLHLTGFNIFIGTDRLYLGDVNKDMIPLGTGGANVQFGINFPIRSHNRVSKVQNQWAR